MQFACEQCSTRYSVPDEKVVGKRVRTQCRKCGAQILIEGPSAPPATAPGGREERLTGSLVRTAPLAAPAQRVPTSRATPVARDDNQWTVAFGPEERRKMSTAELVEAYAQGAVHDETLVWKEGMESWQPPFDVPIIALALQARGFSPDDAAPDSAERMGSLGLESARPPPPSPAAPARDKAARHADSFRSTHPATPSSRAPKPNRPPLGTTKPPAPRRSIPRPPARSVTPAPATPKINPEGITQTGGMAFGDRSLTPGPVPDDAWQEDDEATHVVKDRPPSSRRDAAPITVRGAEPTAGMPQLDHVDGPEGSTEFEFENETTAVIAPDKARALLEAEAQREASAKKPEGRLGFIFDDEATEVIGPERATALLSSDPEAAAAIAAAAAAEGGEAAPRSQPPPKPPRLSPYPGTAKATPPPPTPAAGTPPPPPKLSPYPQGLPPGVPERGPEPSVVVTDARRIRQHADEMTRTLPPKVTRELGGIQHEKTRLVRVVTKKKDSAMSFWVILAIALAAAATGGFLASQMIQRHGAPAWMKLK
jgi:predicted Zn finger-like uncharacterized protein